MYDYFILLDYYIGTSCVVRIKYVTAEKMKTKAERGTDLENGSFEKTHQTPNYP